MVTLVVGTKELSSTGLHCKWEIKKYVILEKHMKTTNFKQNWIIQYYNEQKYEKLIIVVVWYFSECS